MEKLMSNHVSEDNNIKQRFGRDSQSNSNNKKLQRGQASVKTNAIPQETRKSFVQEMIRKRESLINQNPNQSFVKEMVGKRESKKYFTNAHNKKEAATRKAKRAHDRSHQGRPLTLKSGANKKTALQSKSDSTKAPKPIAISPKTASAGDMRLQLTGHPKSLGTKQLKQIFERDGIPSRRSDGDIKAPKGQHAGPTLHQVSSSNDSWRMASFVLKELQDRTTFVNTTATTTIEQEKTPAATTRKGRKKRWMRRGKNRQQENKKQPLPTEYRSFFSLKKRKSNAVSRTTAPVAVPETKIQHEAQQIELEALTSWLWSPFMFAGEEEEQDTLEEPILVILPEVVTTIDNSSNRKWGFLGRNKKTVNSKPAATKKKKAAKSKQNDILKNANKVKRTKLSKKKGIEKMKGILRTTRI